MIASVHETSLYVRVAHIPVPVQPGVIVATEIKKNIQSREEENICSLCWSVGVLCLSIVCLQTLQLCVYSTVPVPVQYIPVRVVPGGLKRGLNPNPNPPGRTCKATQGD